MTTRSAVADAVYPTSVTHTHGPALTAAERRTRIVAVVAAATMGVEIAGGTAFGSLALLADGLHMASHTLAMGIAVFAYAYARQHAANPRFVFGTGKVNVLGGYTGAILLSVTALWMAWESLERMWIPTPIRYAEAAAVGALGLLVNTASAWLLRDGLAHGQIEGRATCCSSHQDLNLQAAYLHVLADAATSVLALVALGVAAWQNMPWLDPLVGLAGAGLVGWWSVGLLRETATMLLDHQAPDDVQRLVRAAVEAHGDHVAELRCWSVGQGRYAAAAAVLSVHPKSSAAYRATLAVDARLAWVSFDVRGGSAPHGDSSAA
jgi:cation diffusion facilitator family transporter